MPWLRACIRERGRTHRARGRNRRPDAAAKPPGMTFDRSSGAHSAKPPRGRYDRSIELFDDAQQWVVGGVKRMNILDAPEHFPMFFARAAGPYAWDADGNRYIDLIGGKGSTLFGSADPDVDAAVVEAIAQGAMLPLTPATY